MTSRREAGAPAALAVKQGSAYHHGGLRAALIAAARDALGTTAPEAISLKSLAAGLGVSQPAPYRHFGSREALLEAVATEGFEQFGAALEVTDAPSERERFERSCLAYLSFGRVNFGLYRLMFASRLLRTTRDEALRQSAGDAFDDLLRRISIFVAPAEVRTTAVWVWSTLHGLVMLEAERLGPGPIEQQVSSAQVVHRMALALVRS